MAHKEQKEYCTKIKNQFPNYFENKKVLDCGSLDINGNNRYLFDNCEYIGIDVGHGKNVDVVSTIHEYRGINEEYDFIISTECFEHDIFYKETILKSSLKNNAYLQVSLILNKKIKYINIHQLVAMAFLGHEPNGFKTVVNHIDFNK
jgi:hypothetical protein